MSPNVAAMLLCALFALQGVAIGHDHDGSAHSIDTIECGCLHADKIEWSLQAIQTEPQAQYFQPLTSTGVRASFQPVSTLVKRARAPPAI